MSNAIVGYEYEPDSRPPVLGESPTIRSGTIIYNDVVSGDDFRTGHNAVVREFTTLGDNVLVGTNTVIDGETDVGSNVSLQTDVYVPTNTTIGDNVFVGPGAVMTNDPAPTRQQTSLRGPTLEDHVSVGANATVLPGLTIGRGSFVAAGSIVTRDVPERRLAVGSPATLERLPEQLRGRNRL
ncbi:DapH/DapD/GlmU-related protein [Natronorubrum halophilum]|uniref:DapH/DapD/GlmU-related protein n=1 Tax=Natronorubrum halophilum TaxID=1702106 RepID=UPI0010C1E938|nr:DapH/DapD/GlmU-related protein [Natronorubrum halophilum]